MLCASLQTIAAQEAEKVRVERLRLEANVIERHSERLDREKETPVHTPVGEEVRDTFCFWTLKALPL